MGQTEGIAAFSLDLFKTNKRIELSDFWDLSGLFICLVCSARRKPIANNEPCIVRGHPHFILFWSSRI